MILYYIINTYMYIYIHIHMTYCILGPRSLADALGADLGAPGGGAAPRDSPRTEAKGFYLSCFFIIIIIIIIICISFFFV